MLAQPLNPMKITPEVEAAEADMFMAFANQINAGKR